MDPNLSRQPRSLENRDIEYENRFFQGFVENLCPYVVICSDKNEASNVTFQCNVGPHWVDSTSQMSGYVRIRNTTCKSWTSSHFQVEEQLVVLKCTDEGGEEVA